MSQFHPSPARSRAAWMLLVAMTGVLALSCVLRAEAAGGTSALAEASAAAGRRMFFGDASLQGAIVGHPEALAPRLAVCANCHGSAGLGPASFGPRLDGTRLTEMRGRRGGPPSAFSPASFCRMLRTGVDPASILITRQMPRYTLDDNQCLGLWHYLTETSDVGSN